MVQWTHEDSFLLGDTEYVCRPFRNRFRSSEGRFCLHKPRWAVELYQDLVRQLRPRRIIEAGILQGASTTFLAEIARPDKLVAFDVSEAPRPALEHFVRTHDFATAISTYDGVDQADTARLTQVVDDEFGDLPLDLIIDDASHLCEPTRRMFNCLFPRLRAGGIYVIEDWSWAHSPLEIWPHETPLTVFVFELILGCAYRPRILEELTINRGWVLVRRGAEPIADDFDISACYEDRGRCLVDGL